MIGSKRTHGGWRRLAMLAVPVALGFGYAGVSVAQDGDAAPAGEQVAGAAPPERFVGPDTETDRDNGCIKCHTNEYKAWQETHHHNSVAMHRTDLAKGMRRAFKIRRLQQDPLCQNCHFTLVMDKGEAAPNYGVSCESCHGAGKEWVPIHSNEEKWPEREPRMQMGEEKGMIRPASLYRLAQNCYQCHILAKTPPEAETKITVEQLVNTPIKIRGQKESGYHSAGTEGFELVSFSQGEVRHNLRNTDQANNESRFKRGLYVVGKLLDLEYSLRALSNATEAEGRFFTGIKQRLDGENNAIAALEAIRAALPEDLAELGAAIDAAVAAGKAAPLEVNKQADLLAAADAVRDAAKSQFDGKTEEAMTALEAKLAPIDSLLPAAGSYRGSVYKVE